MNKKSSEQIKGILVLISYFLLPYLVKVLSISKILVGTVYILYSLILIYLYKETIINDIKYIKKNKTKCVKDIIINVLLLFVVVILINLIIGLVLGIKETSSNDFSLVALFNKKPVIIVFLTCIYYPIVEGIVFRKSIRDVIDNKWFFIIFSSLIYFFFNIVYTNIDFNSIMTSICYFFSMIVLSNYYWRSKNFTSSVLIMMLYNVITTILRLI